MRYEDDCLNLLLILCSLTVCCKAGVLQSYSLGGIGLSCLHSVLSWPFCLCQGCKVSISLALGAYVVACRHSYTNGTQAILADCVLCVPSRVQPLVPCLPAEEPWFDSSSNKRSLDPSNYTHSQVWSGKRVQEEHVFWYRDTGRHSPDYTWELAGLSGEWSYDGQQSSEHQLVFVRSVRQPNSETKSKPATSGPAKSKPVALAHTVMQGASQPQESRRPKRKR